jgi:hypothetical protein
VTTPIATTDDLATYLNVTDIDLDRANLLLTLAQDKCEAVVSPLPITALGVVLDIAARAYSNPTATQSTAPGPFGTPLGSLPGGLFLTKTNIAELSRLSTTNSGAFTIDPTPADAGPNNYWPQVPLAVEETGSAQWLGDWDSPT